MTSSNDIFKRVADFRLMKMSGVILEVMKRGGVILD